MKMRLGLLLGATVLAASVAATPGFAQGITTDALIAQVSAACQVSTAACESALADAVALAATLPSGDQATFGAQLALFAIANPALEPLIRAALLASGEAVMVASYNATHGGSIPVVVLPTVPSPA
jgi:hypothetical protein